MWTRRETSNRIVATAAAAASVSQPAFAESVTSETAITPPPQFDAVRNEIRARVEKGELPSFAVGVIRDGQVVWAEAFGWADREARTTATRKTVYGLASLGKSITATAAMTLVERGRIGLDDRVSRVLSPERLTIYEGGADGPTLRQLLNMTAGIPHGAITYTDLQAAAEVSEDQVLHNRALVVFPPGEVFHYSNFSIAVADRVIEKASGRDFGDYLRQAVFQPLTMRESFVRDNMATDPKTAVRYDEDGKRIGPIYLFPRSSRGIHASLDDLLAYAFFHLKRPRSGQTRLMSVSAIDALHNSVSAVPGGFMALGIGHFDLPSGRRWLVSNGQDMGAQSMLSILPSANVAVVCLANATGDQADAICLRIADVLVPGFLTEASAVIAALESAGVAFKSSGDWVGEWRGGIKTSAGDLPIVMNFEANADIKISIADQYPTLLDEPQLGGGLLSGAFLARVPLEERPNHYHRVELGLKLDNDRLYGFAFANFANERGHFELPTYIGLKRATAG